MGEELYQRQRQPYVPGVENDRPTTPLSPIGTANPYFLVAIQRPGDGFAVLLNAVRAAAELLA